MQVSRVAFLSCGWPLPAPEGHGTSIALETDDGVVLVDGGGDVAQGLAATFGLERLGHVYVTHEHADHTWGLPGLVHGLRFAGERGPLQLHGPEPALVRVQRALDALGIEVPYELVWTPIEVAGGKDARARWAPCDHTVATLAYRFGDVVVCGDTRPAQAVIDLSRNASLLCHEASHTDAALVGRVGHATPAGAGEVARKAGVGTLALIHIHPSLPREEALAGCGFQPAIAPRDGDLLLRSGDGWQMHAGDKVGT